MKESAVDKIDYKNPLITVIMPVYNSDCFVADAIESVLHQTYSFFELLLIDDGSTDDSKRICDEYEMRDERVISIHKDNGGVCSSRNMGIDMAHGEYLAFIDNDDEYDERYLETLTANLACQYDVIKCGRKNIRIDSSGRKTKQTVMSVRENASLGFDEYIGDYYKFKRAEIWGSVWNGLYKVEFLKKNGLRFDETLKHGNEDLIFSYQVLAAKPHIYIYKDALYMHYYRMKHSTSMKFYEDQVSSRIYAIKTERNIIKDLASEENRILTEFEEIRECFRIIAQSENRNIRKKSVSKVERELDFSVLNKTDKYWQSLDYKQQIDLFLIKNRLYCVYFIYKRVQRSIGR